MYVTQACMSYFSTVLGGINVLLNKFYQEQDQRSDENHFLKWSQLVFIASLVLLLIIKLRFPKGKSIHRVNKFCCGRGFNVIVCALSFQAYNSLPVQAIWSINYRRSNSFPYQMLFIPKWEPMAGQRRPMGPLINCLMYHLCDGCLAQQRLFCANS